MSEIQSDNSQYNNAYTALTHGINSKDGLAQFMILLAILGLSFFIGQLLSGGVLYAFYGMDVANMNTLIKKHNDLNGFRYAQMLTTIFSFLVPAIIFSKMKDKKWWHFNKADRTFNTVLLILIPLLILSFYPLINVSFFINKYLGISNWGKGLQGDYKAVVTALTSGTSLVVLALNLITIAILPAICEEWIFRGSMQRMLTDKINIHLAILISAVVFSLIHLEFSGFLPRIFLGMLLGYIYYYSGSLWACIYAHMLNNGAQVIAIYLSNRSLYTANMDSPDFPTSGELLIFTPLFVGLFYGMVYLSRQKKSTFA